MPPTVAFSLSAPLAQAAVATKRQPVLTLVPVLVLLLPLVPLIVAARLVLRDGGSAALQGLIAGAPIGRPGALIMRPDLTGWLLIAALAALLTTMLAVVLAAGLVSGATGARPAPLRGRPGSSLSGAVMGTLAVWPAMFVVLVFELLAVAAAAGLVAVLAIYAGRIQFQLPGVVLTLALGSLLIVVVRCNLWPAVALAEQRPPLASLRRSWALTRGSVVRLMGAALAALLAVGVPAAIVHTAIKASLTALAGHEVIGLSPIAIDLWALLPLPFAIIALSTLWGREVPALVAALDAFGPDEPLAA